MMKKTFALLLAAVMMLAGVHSLGDEGVDLLVLFGLVVVSVHDGDLIALALQNLLSPAPSRAS